jgi:hypothetical protein
MNKVLDSGDGWVFASGQALVRFALLASTHETLDLDHLLHILLVELLLLRELLSNDHSPC